MKNKKIKIAIDIDDCICNTLDTDFTYGYYYAKRNNLFNEEIDYDNQYFFVPKTFNMDKNQELDFFQTEKQIIMDNMLMFPFAFAKDVINTLYTQCEITILSSREDIYWNNKTYQYAKKWLKKYSFKFNKLVVNCLNKGIFCKENNISLLIEDNFNHAQSVNDLGIKTILLKKSYNKNYANNLNKFALNWLHAFDIINNDYFSNTLQIKLKKQFL